MMRIFLILSAVLTLSYCSVFASDNMTYYIDESYTVGKTPLKLIPVQNNDGSSKLHIFCAGEDLNYDDVIDEGDEAPSWWILDNKNSVPRKVMDFETFFIYRPFRPGFDKENSFLYLPLTEKIISIDLKKEEVANDKIADVSAASIHFFDNKLLVTINEGIDLTGSIKVINLITKDTFESGATGINPVESITFPETDESTVAVLNQGKYGAGNSLLSIGKFDNNYQFIPKVNFEVGNSANHLVYHNGKIYVTVNMTHCVVVCDIKTRETQTLYTGTSGWNGPRESHIIGNDLYVTTYSGDVRVFDIGSGNLKDILKANGIFSKIENMAMWDANTLMTTKSYDEFYTAQNSIYSWVATENEMIQALKSVTVGAAPVGIVFDEGKNFLHIFCKGNDVNENGSADPEDELPSWWLVDANNKELSAIKKAEFDFGAIKYPFRPAVDKQNKIIYIPANNSIRSYDMNNFEMLDDMVSKYDAVALEMAGTHLMAAVRYPDKNDTIVVINLQTGMVLQKVPTGKKVIDLKYYPLLRSGQTQPEISLAILSSNDNNDQSFLAYGPIKHMAEFTLNNGAMVGNGANRIAYRDNILAVSSFSSNDSYIVDAEKGTNQNVKLGTMNPQGPLSLVTIPNLGFMVGTQYGDIRMVYAIRSEIDSSIISYLNSISPVDMPVETFELYISQLNNDMILALSSAYINGNINREVKILSRIPTTVKDYQNGEITSIKIYPNPAAEYLNIETQLRYDNIGNLKLELVSLNGEILGEFKLPPSRIIEHTLDIRNLGLANGTYLIRLVNGNEIKSIPFNVVK